MNAFADGGITVGKGNSTNDTALAGARGLDGTIDVEPGDSIPLTPRHLLKTYADFTIGKRSTVDLNLVAASSVYARGNENNAHQPDGMYYLGSGKSPGYGIVNFGIHYRVHAKLELIGQINNLLYHRYYTASQIGPSGFSSDGSCSARPLPANGSEFPVVQSTFYAPGAPRTFWIGTRVRF